MINKQHFFLKYICDSLCNDDVPMEIIDEFPITHSNQTACVIQPYINNAWITLNMAQLEILPEELIQRGYDMQYAVIQVLLHEICHYKQYRKAMNKKGWFKAYKYKRDNKNRNQYHELVADRYARYCLKKIIKDLKQWKNILDTN